MCKKMICLTTLIVLLGLLGNTYAGTPFIEPGHEMTDDDLTPAAIYSVQDNGIIWPIDPFGIDRVLLTTNFGFDPAAASDPNIEIVFDMGSPGLWDRFTWWNRQTGGDLFAVNVDIYSLGSDPCGTPVLVDMDLITVFRSTQTNNDGIVRDDIDLTPFTARYILVVFDDGPQAGGNIQGSEIAFGGVKIIPDVGDPAPANNGTDYGRNQTLVWGGTTAAQTKVDVYFGISESAVDAADTGTAGIYKGRQDISIRTHTPNDILLDPDTDYFWRIDAINDANINDVIFEKGTVWKFTTDGYLVIDDIETYGERNTLAAGRLDDQEELRRVWIDGFDGSTTMTSGAFATVNTARESHGPGDPGTGPAHRDYLSLAIDYDNDGFQIFVIQPAPKVMVIASSTNKYSEVYAATTGANSLEIGSDWTAENSVALQLYFSGPNTQDVHTFNETLYLVLEDSNNDEGMVLYGGAAADLNDEDWHSWDIDLADPCFADVNMADVQKIVIGFGVRGETATAGGTGVMYIDDIRLHPVRCRVEKSQLQNDYNGDCIVDYKDLQYILDLWLEDNR